MGLAMKRYGATETGDALRPQTARGATSNARVPRRAATGGESRGQGAADELGRAIEAKQRDNLVLGETLVSFGLLQRSEMVEVQKAQAKDNDVVGSLMVASAIRSRLGDILLHAKRITSAQLEQALEIQRQRGGLLGEVLVGMGVLDRGTLGAALVLQGGR